MPAASSSAVCSAPAGSSASTERRDARREDRLGISAEHHARQRDADLRRGDVAVEPLRILDDRQEPRGERVAVLARRRSRLRRTPTAPNSAAT